MSDKPYTQATVIAQMPVNGCDSDFDRQIKLLRIHGLYTGQLFGEHGRIWDYAPMSDEPKITVDVSCEVHFLTPISDEQAARAEAVAAAAPFFRQFAIDRHNAYVAECKHRGTLAEIFAAAMKGDAK